MLTPIQRISLAAALTVSLASCASAQALVPVTLQPFVFATSAGDSDKGLGEDSDHSDRKRIQLGRDLVIVNLTGEELTFTILQDGVVKQVVTLVSGGSLHDANPRSGLAQLVVSKNGIILDRISIILTDATVVAHRGPSGSIELEIFRR